MEMRAGIGRGLRCWGSEISRDIRDPRMSFAIRREMPKSLRRKLNELGVPVCMRCGYDLRGARPDVTCCTECGAALSQREVEARRRADAAPAAT